MLKSQMKRCTTVKCPCRLYKTYVKQLVEQSGVTWDIIRKNKARINYFKDN